MKLVSFRVPEALFERMNGHDINWSDVLREAVALELTRRERGSALDRLEQSATLVAAPRGTAVAALRKSRRER